MIDLTMFRERVFSGGVGAMILWGFGVMGIYFFTAMYLQNVLRFSPTEAGAAFVPMALFMAMTAPVADPIARRFGTHRTVATGVTFNVIGLIMVSFVGEAGSFADLMPAFVLFGVGSGLVMMPLTSAIIGVLPENRAAAASGVLNTAREVSGLLGVTIVGAILTTRQAASARGGADPLHSFLDGYQFALVIAAAIVFVGAPIAWYTMRTRKAPEPEPEPVEELTPEPVA
jgi:MFS family permease